MAEKNDRPDSSETFEQGEPAHVPSPTAVAGDAASRGVLPPEVIPPEEPQIPHEDELLEMGDPDVSPISNAYVGDESPGFDMPTTDQDNVDVAGEAYGVAEADEGELRPAAEIVDARDRHRAFQEEPEPPERPEPPEE
jgi:hypothetical protein